MFCTHQPPCLGRIGLLPSTLAPSMPPTPATGQSRMDSCPPVLIFTGRWLDLLHELPAGQVWGLQGKSVKKGSPGRWSLGPSTASEWKQACRNPAGQLASGESAGRGILIQLFLHARHPPQFVTFIHPSHLHNSPVGAAGSSSLFPSWGSRGCGAVQRHLGSHRARIPVTAICLQSPALSHLPSLSP